MLYGQGAGGAGQHGGSEGKVGDNVDICSEVSNLYTVAPHAQTHCMCLPPATMRPNYPALLMFSRGGGARAPCTQHPAALCSAAAHSVQLCSLCRSLPRRAPLSGSKRCFRAGSSWRGARTASLPSAAASSGRAGAGCWLRFRGGWTSRTWCTGWGTFQRFAASQSE